MIHKTAGKDDEYSQGAHSDRRGFEAGIPAPGSRTMIRDSHFRAKQPFRARGVAELSARIGDVDAEIVRRLDAGTTPVRVLELGCGYGSVLLEWRQRHGERIALTGLNREEQDGDDAIVRRNGIERGLVDASDTAAMPALAFGDAADGLPFADASFDLVVSQVAWLYFGRKAHVLREIARVLDRDGVARIDADEIHPRLPPEYARLFEIWHRGRLVPLGDYLARHGGAIRRADQGEYLAFGKLEGLGDDLLPVAEIDLATIDPDWDGIKCIYRLRG
jgi:SAM-dependent methyltransferase